MALVLGLGVQVRCYVIMYSRTYKRMLCISLLYFTIIEASFLCDECCAARGQQIYFEKMDGPPTQCAGGAATFDACAH
jgi:hypothetical protein